jgi:predicted  nucleic acid-binding Zn-ribbon protein
MVITEQKDSDFSIVKLLHQLVAINTQIVKAEEQITVTNKRILEYKNQAIQTTEKLKNLEHSILVGRKKLIHCEGEAKFLKDTEDEKKKHLETIQNPKEYKAATRELDLLKKRTNQFEEELLTCWQEVENLELKITQETQLSASKLTEITVQLENEKSNLENLSKLLKKLLEEKVEKSILVPAEWLTRYERMQMSVADPIVEIRENSCGSCFYTIVAQELMRLKKGEILLCRSCYRFLYVNPEPSSNP